MVEQKSLKQYCREAKKRLKSGFWKEHSGLIKEQIIEAENNGVSASKVKDYLTERVAEKIKHNTDNFEDFYKRVKEILDTEGEVSDVIGRLTDENYYKSLSYEEKQRYNLSISEKYLKALERYRKEKSLMLIAK